MPATGLQPYITTFTIISGRKPFYELIPVIGIFMGKGISNPMRKTQSHLLHSTQLPVTVGAIALAHRAEAVFPSLDCIFRTTKQHNKKEKTYIHFLTCQQ
jgi:sorbitol-specific phosphotransferase system component IIC